MENRFQHPTAEEQGWGAYATPPKYGSRQAGLCADVCRMLPDLLENDGSVRPEMASAISAHVAVCPDCSREYEQMQRVIARIEALPPAEMPMDFSGPIMRQIQVQVETTRGAKIPARQVQHSPVNAPVEKKVVAIRPVVGTGTITAAQLRSGQQSDTITQTRAQAWQRVTLGAILSGLLAFFLNNAWGRQMLGVNLANATGWLEQIGESMSRLPLVGGIVGLVVSALAQTSGLLSETYHSLGSLAARGLALDIAMGVLAYYYVLNRRQREQRLGV
jgi:hypothetical protein